ncbi:DEAD/DEAH box helicase [Aliihoeflea aestuarii]|uniref:DEAD/DEAH box helicase n=1 Tax=Aliihoeflea aestuarii TaxID=453840 RepID=UPI0020962AA3|nr:DEAD/DEAH box helicase [Aliihoeflea aestuarii]MCO6392714.1 DEAD/DEAH box helicase [Aliihoeflea aestuarii]
MSEFEGILPALAAALTKRGYTSLTPVQKAVTGPELGDGDALVSAQTGSGKTVAFGLALAPTLLGDKQRFGPAATPLALAVAPTRELALQVKRELEWLYAEAGATVASCVGGMDMRSERRTLERGAQIVVGTPGRLRDHITRGSLDMSDIRAVVLDEADEMLDLGFREDLEFILEAAPAERRTLMFSATVSKPIAELAKSYQRDAKRISTASNEARQHGDIEYRALSVAEADRENAIINVLRYYEPTNALVFCATRAAVNHMTARFNNRGFSVVALSGELSQNERTHALQAMRDGRAQVCIATDVAARGIDLPNLELVVHADLPTNKETLLHRSGRTGRAGRKGMSVLIVPNRAGKRAGRLLQGAGITAQWGKPPTAEEVMQRDDERLLADPALSEAVGEDEADFVQRILATHSAEQVAAAFVRAYRAGRSAPEDLIDVKPGSFDDSAKPTRDRDDFGPAVWFSLSVGRKQNAEPRWLIPMLCRNGNLTKRDIGAIKMMPEETFVEIAEGSAERFAAVIGKKGDLERGIRVKRVEGTPDFAAGRSEKKPHRGQKPDTKDWSKKPGKPKFDKPKSEGFKKKKPKRD